MHSGRCDGVPSSWVPTVPGMMLQCQGRRHSDGDGRTGPEMMEETRPDVTAPSQAGAE
jgi:hypothetical protein